MLSFTQDVSHTSHYSLLPRRRTQKRKKDAATRSPQQQALLRRSFFRLIYPLSFLVPRVNVNASTANENEAPNRKADEAGHDKLVPERHQLFGRLRVHISSLLL